MSSPTSASVRVRQTSSRSSGRSTSRGASSLFEEISRGGEYRCVPGHKVFNADGSVKGSYVTQISSAYIMLPDGTYQKFDEYCASCKSPLPVDNGKVKVNVLFGQQGKPIFPFQFKNLTIYAHLWYRTCVNDQWVTVSGQYLQPSGDSSFLIYCRKPNGAPVRVYDLFPITEPTQPSYPFYFKNVQIDHDKRYKVYVNNRYLVVYGSQLHPGSDSSSLFLYQGPGNLVPVADLYVYESLPRPQASYSFIFKGLPVYSYSYYKVCLETGEWITVMGSQIALGQDGRGAVFYKDPSTPLRIDLIQAVNPPTIGSYQPAAPASPTYNPYQRPLSPKVDVPYPQSQSPSGGYHPYYPPPQSPNINVNYHPPAAPDATPLLYQSPTHTGYYPGKAPSPKPPSPSYHHHHHSSYNYSNYNQEVNYRPPQKSPPPKKSPPKQQQRPRVPSTNTTQNTTVNTTIAYPVPVSPDGSPVNPYNPTKNTVPPTSRRYPFTFKTMKIYAERMYQVKINGVWELVHGDQMHPARNDPNSLIVNFANFTAAVVTDVFMYEPQRYTPVQLTINGVVIQPDKRYFVSIGTAGMLLVPGNMIQRHTSKPGGVVWYDGTYHDIVSIQVILNSTVTDSEFEVIGVSQVATNDSQANSSTVVNNSTEVNNSTAINNSTAVNNSTEINNSTQVNNATEVTNKPDVCTCSKANEPCSILPYPNICPTCSGNLLSQFVQNPTPEPRPLPGSPLRSPSRTTKVTEHHQSSSLVKQSSSSNKTALTKTVNFETSSPDEEETTSSSASDNSNAPKVFKDLTIMPELLYKVMLESGQDKIVPGSWIRTKTNRKYVNITINKETYKSYFIRPVTPDRTESEDTPRNPGFYRIYLNGRWRVVPNNNVRPSKRRPGRYVVIYDSKKYIIKAVNVVPIYIPDDTQYPNLTDTTSCALSPTPSRRPTCDSPVHPHPISPKQWSSLSPPDNTLQPRWRGRSSSSSNTTPGVTEPRIVPLSTLYDAFGILKPQYASMLALHEQEPRVVLPRGGTSYEPQVILPDMFSNPPPEDSLYINPDSPRPSDLPSPKPSNLKPSPKPSPSVRVRVRSTEDTQINTRIHGSVTEKKSPMPTAANNSPMPQAINGVLVYPELQYTLEIQNTTYTVLGKHFKPRKEFPGQFTVKAGDCRFLVPSDVIITPHFTSYAQSNPSPKPPKNVTFDADPVDSDTPEEGGFLTLIRGNWVRVGPKAVRPSKTQVGYAVVKYKEGVHLVLERDVHPLHPNEDIINLECSLPDGKRLLRTWFVEKLPPNCLDSIKSLARSNAEDPVFVLRNSGTRNINDKDIRKLTTCIRTHFENAQIIFEDDYLQLMQGGYGVRCPIWVNVRKNKAPNYYKLIDDLTDKSYMDVSVSDNSYLNTSVSLGTGSSSLQTGVTYRGGSRQTSSVAAGHTSARQTSGVAAAHTSSARQTSGVAAAHTSARQTYKSSNQRFTSSAVTSKTSSVAKSSALGKSSSAFTKSSNLAKTSPLPKSLPLSKSANFGKGSPTAQSRKSNLFEKIDRRVNSNRLT